MKTWLLELLQCPGCHSDVPLSLVIEEESAEEIIAGSLRCGECSKHYPIEAAIPRFVAGGPTYSENFGVQWRAFRTTQIDRLAGHTLSEHRFFKDTRWPPEWLAGKCVLDAGCGAGRFADIMARHGARVVACDLSSAVEACRATEIDPRGRSAARGEIEVVQADLLALPFKEGAFDGVHCAGVIQHLPDPQRGMRELTRFARPGGHIFFNFYEIDPSTRFQFFKNVLRRTTPNWSMPALFRFCRWLCRTLFLPSFIMSRIPVVRFFNRFLPICSVHPSGIPLRQQYEMTLLDTIDWYGARYEIRQDHRQVADLLRQANVIHVTSAPGLAWGIKADDPSAR